jgi:PAS domain S-box-containing protein
MSDLSAKSIRNCRLFSRWGPRGVALVAAVVIGKAAFLFWNLPVVTPSWPGMVPLAALASLMASLVLWQQASTHQKNGHSKWMMLAATTVLLVGLGGAFQHVISLEPGWTNWWRSIPETPVAAPGGTQPLGPQNSLLISFSFTLLGVALLHSVWSRRSDNNRLSNALIIPVIFVNWISFAANISAAEAFIRPGLSPNSSLLNSGTLLVLGLSALCQRPQLGLLGVLNAGLAGSAMMRRLLLPVVIVPIGINWLVMKVDHSGLYLGGVASMVDATVTSSILVVLLWFVTHLINQKDAAHYRSMVDLRVSESRFTNAFEHAPLGMSLVATNGKFIKVNRELAALLGYTEKELLALTFQELTYPDDIASDVAQIERLLKGELQSYRMEKRYFHKNGEIIHAISSVSLVSDEFGLPRYFVSQIQDITKRKQEEEKIRLLGHAIESSREMVCIASMDDLILFANQAFQIGYGYSLNELLGQSMELMVGRDHTGQFQQVMMNATHDGGWSGEILGQRQDGRQFWIRLNSSVVRNGRGEIIAIMGVARDITAEREASEAMNLFRDLLDHSPDAIEVIDPETGRFLDGNARAYASLGYTREEFLSAKVVDIAPNLDEETYLSNLARLKSVGQISFEVTRRRKDGSIFPVEINLVLVKHQRDYILSNVRDLSERQHSEREISNLHNEMAHLSRIGVLNELTTTLTHELNQPLTAILTNANVGLRMLRKMPLDILELDDIFSDIAADDQRAADIIRRTRELVATGETRHEAICLNGLVKTSLKLIQSAALLHKVDIRIELATRLPSLRGDPVQLQQVLLNLMMNAIQAMVDMPQKKRQLVVRTDIEAVKTVRVQVADTGKGLPENQESRIFDPLFSTKSTGIGMGLAICRTIIIAHGGEIHAHNNPDGPGAIFECILQSSASPTPYA